MKKPKAYRFTLHYNRAASLHAGKVMWTVHYRKTCYVVNSVVCSVPTVSKTNKRQPYAVMQGFASNVIIDSNKNVATII